MTPAPSKSLPTLRRLLPRALEPRVEQLSKDLRSLIAGIRGERPPAYLVRDGARFVGRSGLATRELEIAAVRRETPSAVSLRLRDPSGAPLPEIRPGQFFTLLLELPDQTGQPLRRAYSVSSDCRQREHVELTIKQAEAGRASTWLNQHAAPGMRVRVLGPSGEFGRIEPAPEGARKQLVLIAGGSGITPMMAMLRSDIDAEITLIYANRSQPEVIFAEAITTLARERPGLRVVHLLEDPPDGWTGVVGRADKRTLATVLDSLDLPADAQFLLCGPTPMMAGAIELLRERDVPESHVHSESFVAPHLQAEAEARLRGPQAVTVVIDTREVGLVVRPGETLLEAGLASGLPLPYSCAMGGCGACKVVLERGEVVMREPNCLSEREREAGQVLACVANPVSACRVRA